MLLASAEHVIEVLAGWASQCVDWDQVIQDAQMMMEDERTHCSFNPADCEHRRGAFYIEMFVGIISLPAHSKFQQQHIVRALPSNSSASLSNCFSLCLQSLLL